MRRLSQPTVRTPLRGAQPPAYWGTWVAVVSRHGPSGVFTPLGPCDPVLLAHRTRHRRTPEGATKDDGAPRRHGARAEVGGPVAQRRLASEVVIPTSKRQRFSFGSQSGDSSGRVRSLRHLAVIECAVRIGDVSGEQADVRDGVAQVRRRTCEVPHRSGVALELNRVLADGRAQRGELLIRSGDCGGCCRRPHRRAAAAGRSPPPEGSGAPQALAAGPSPRSRRRSRSLRRRWRCRRAGRAR